MSYISRSTSVRKAGSPPSAGPDNRSNWTAAVIIGLVSIGMGFVAGYFNPFLSHSPAEGGAQVDRLFGVLLGVGTTIFFIVQGALIYSIVRFRRTSNDDEEEGAAFHGNVPMEIVWTAIPAVLVTALAIYSYAVLVSTETPQPDAIIVQVTGRQFAWDFYYPDRDLHSAELHVPRGRQVLLKMRSDDVIHAFWVPDFRIKKDLMPDRETELRFTADKDGTYPVVCSRLCGVGHAYMRSNVIVQEPNDYYAWLYQQQTGAQAPVNAADPAAVGRQLFQQYGCNACHTLADANASGQVGPNLNGIATKAGSMVPGESAEQYLRESIVKPNAYIVPGYQANIMPQNFADRISQQELDALVKYLLMQK